MSRRLGRRVTVVAVTAAAGLLVLAGTASAHVTANPGTATQGGDAEVAFRTPNEEDTAATVKLEVSFPTDHPIPSVLVHPIPGWTATIEKAKLATPITTDDGPVSQAVSKITWSGGQIAPDQYQDFDVSLESLPSDTTQLVFKAIQTYSNGDVIRWIDLTPPGGAEPEHPAPTITLTKSTGDTPETDTEATAATTQSGSSGGGAALTLGIIGAILGLVGAALGGLALRRSSTGSHTG
jgi:periplasmic copper chaperone A